MSDERKSTLADEIDASDQLHAINPNNLPNMPLAPFPRGFSYVMIPGAGRAFWTYAGYPCSGCEKTPPEGSLILMIGAGSMFAGSGYLCGSCLAFISMSADKMRNEGRLK